MPARQADAIILRTYPLRESDRIVSFLTRQFGKVRGVARGARRPRGGFGAALEPLTQLRVAYFERPNRDLVSLDRCEVVHSMLAAQTADYEHAVILAYIAELADRLLPEHQVHDAVYRLLTVVLAALRAGAPPWLALLYDLYWMVRLEGFLPDLASDPRLGEEARHWGALFARTPLEGIAVEGWEKGARASDLRRFLHQRVEEHVEQHLQSWKLLQELP